MDQLYHKIILSKSNFSINLTGKKIWYCRALINNRDAEMTLHFPQAMGYH